MKNIKLNKPLIIGLVALLFVAVFTVSVLLYSSTKAKDVNQQLQRQNMNALEQIIDESRADLIKLQSNCAESSKLFQRKDCQQVAYAVYQIVKPSSIKENIRHNLSSNGWLAMPWKPEGATYFIAQDSQSHVDAFAEAAAIRHTQEVDTQYFKVTIVENVAEIDNALDIGGYAMDLTAQDITDFNLPYLVVISVHSLYKGSF